MSADAQESETVTTQGPVAPRRFVGKVAFITGAGVYGIGGAVALRLAGEGAAVHLATCDDPTDLVKKLTDFGCGASWTLCDVTVQGDVDRARDECLAAYGQIDVLVNNAGIDSIDHFSQLSDETWEKVLAVNLTGVMRVTRALLPELEKQRGVVVNISSASAMGGTPGLVAYGASKAGLNGLTQALASELAKKKVRVVGVAPALTRTPMAMKYVDDLTAETWQKVQQCHPLGIGKVEDVAAAVAFLASSEAKWISGVTLPLGWMPTYPMPLLE
jgi:NAD(P)-dependent dehydrogenase (short-subunit alcohol dehydrogenase family)